MGSERIHQRLAEGDSHTIDDAIDVAGRRIGCQPGGKGMVERGQRVRCGRNARKSWRRSQVGPAP